MNSIVIEESPFELGLEKFLELIGKYVFKAVKPSIRTLKLKKVDEKFKA